MPATKRGPGRPRKAAAKIIKGLSEAAANAENAKLKRIIERQKKSLTLGNSRLGACLGDLKNMRQDRDHLRLLVQEGRVAFDLERKHVTSLDRQLNHLHALYGKLVERYAATKIDTQQMTFIEGRAFLDAEFGALSAALAAIREQVEAEWTNGCAMQAVQREAA